MNLWPHTDTPGAGPLSTSDLDAACWRKRQIVQTLEQRRAVDEMAGVACASCGNLEACPTPQACHQPENLSGFPLEPILARHSWLGPVMVALLVIVWLCLDGYFEALP